MEPQATGLTRVQCLGEHHILEWNAWMTFYPRLQCLGGHFAKGTIRPLIPVIMLPRSSPSRISSIYWATCTFSSPLSVRIATSFRSRSKRACLFGGKTLLATSLSYELTMDVKSLISIFLDKSLNPIANSTHIWCSIKCLASTLSNGQWTTK